MKATYDRRACTIKFGPRLLGRGIHSASTDSLSGVSDKLAQPEVMRSELCAPESAADRSLA